MNPKPPFGAEKYLLKTNHLRFSCGYYKGAGSLLIIPKSLGANVLFESTQTTKYFSVPFYVCEVQGDALSIPLFT
jgi:hypothetical protein